MADQETELQSRLFISLQQPQLHGSLLAGSVIEEYRKYLPESYSTGLVDNLLFDVPVSPYTTTENGEIVYSPEWLGFVADFIDRSNYAVDEREDEVIFSRGIDSETGIEKVTTISHKLTNCLALLHKYGFEGEHNIRYPQNIRPDQNTQFHHYLRVAVIAGKSSYNDQVLEALFHDYFDFQGNNNQYYDETARLGELVGALGGDIYKAGEMRKNAYWMDLLEATGKTVFHDISEQVPELRFNKKRILKGLHYSERALASLESFGFSTTDLVAKLPMLIQLIELAENPDDVSEIPGLEGSVSANLNKWRLEIKELVVAEVGTKPLLTLMWNLTDALMFPKNPSLSDLVSGNHTVGARNDAMEASKFHLEFAEFTGDQRALSILKNRVYELIDPEYHNMVGAVEELRQEGYFRQASEKMAQTQIQIRDIMTFQGYREMGIEEYEARFKEARATYATYEEFLANASDILPVGLFVITKHRVKSVGSTWEKIKKPKNANTYDRYVEGFYPYFGHNKKPERFSPDWFKMVLPIVPDLLGAKIILGASKDTPDDEEDWKREESVISELQVEILAGLTRSGSYGQACLTETTGVLPFVDMREVFANNRAPFIPTYSDIREMLISLHSLDQVMEVRSRREDSLLTGYLNTSLFYNLESLRGPSSLGLIGAEFQVGSINRLIIPDGFGKVSHWKYKHGLELDLVNAVQALNKARYNLAKKK